MNRSDNAICIKMFRMFDDGSIQSYQVKIDAKAQKIIGKSPLSAEQIPLHLFETPFNENDNSGVIKFNYSCNYDESTVKLIKVKEEGYVNNVNQAMVNENRRNPGLPRLSINTTLSPTFTPVTLKRECKVPNIPTMIRCQNCDTNFPTKYQFQRHQCEFNAEKVVLKPNVDAKDIAKGVRMKFDCPTCGKQFVSKNNLERHLTSHDEDNVNICEYCSKHFVSENRLRIHKENHCKKAGDISKFYRSDVTVWKCIKCFQVFSSETYASNHADNCSDFLDPNDFKSRVLNDDNMAGKPKFDDVGNEIVTLAGSKYVEKTITELLLHCEFCNKTYAEKKSLLMHQKTHTTSVNYLCVVCDEHFDSYVQAGKHWLTKCLNEANLFYLPKLAYCNYCDRTFKSHEVLYLHKIKKKHYNPKRHISNDNEILQDTSLTGVRTATEPKNTVKPAEENKETIIKLIEDVLCSIKLKVNDSNSSTPLSSSNEAQSDKENDELGSNSNIKYEEMSESSSLVISEDAHGGDDANGSSPGKKKRGRKRKLTTTLSNNGHKKLSLCVDPGYKYQCERCVEVFDNITDMEAHRDKEHPANYKCEECDQVVHSSKALLIHSRAHQSLKPYVCEICKRCYSQTSHLWQHMRFHQGIKPFACPHQGCEARYTIRPDLKDHIRKVHTRERPFKCSVCDKCFLTGSVYYQHRLIHTNDRRYACDICNKRFFRADALNNHRRIHTDERPYPCNVCGRHFRQKGDRNKHVRTQHPAAPTAIA